MSSFIRVLCRQSGGVSPAELAQFVRDGVFFDDPPSFDPSDALSQTASEDWSTLAIHFHPQLRPVIVWKTAGGPLLADEIAEAVEALSMADDPIKTELIDRLSATSVIYALEINESTLTDEAWNMVDSLEAHLARRGAGIVYAPDDGFFDEDLERLVTVPESE